MALTKCLSLHNVLPLPEICQQIEFINEFLNARARAFLVSTFEVVSLAYLPWGRLAIMRARPRHAGMNFKFQRSPWRSASPSLVHDEQRIMQQL